MRDDFAFEGVEFDDGRGLYPERVRAPAPLGTNARLKRRATEEGISAGELIRRAVFSYLGGQGEGPSSNLPFERLEAL